KSKAERCSARVRAHRCKMNVGRGLLRAWIFVSVLWVIALGWFAYSDTAWNIRQGKWQYRHYIRVDTDFDKADWKRPYYENMRSPSAEKLEAKFYSVGYEYTAQWDQLANAGKLKVVEIPDGSSLYLSTYMNEQDQDYIARAFWDQRWSR